MTEKSQREQNYDWFNERRNCFISNDDITIFLNKVEELMESGMSNEEALNKSFSMLGAIYD